MGRVTITLLGLVLWFCVVHSCHASVAVLAEQQREQHRDIRNTGGERSTLSLPEQADPASLQELVKRTKMDNIRDEYEYMDFKKSLSATSPQEMSPVVQERSRLLAVPYTRTNAQAKQIFLSGNTHQDYQYINLRRTISVAYVSRLRKILVSTYSPLRIVSYNLDRPGMRTVREGIRSYGMAVDEERQLVFFTTTYPSNTVSRMTTRGRQFQLVEQLSRYHSPFSIALDPINRRLYVANAIYILSLGYDGEQKQTLYTGLSIYAVVLDPIENTIYFNDNSKVMRMSSSGTETRDVYDLGYKAWKMVFYNNSLYIGGYSFRASEKYIDVVYVDVNDVSTEYQRLRTFDSSNGMNICLLP